MASKYTVETLSRETSCLKGKIYAWVFIADWQLPACTYDTLLVNTNIITVPYRVYNICMYKICQQQLKVSQSWG